MYSRDFLFKQGWTSLENGGGKIKEIDDQATEIFLRLCYCYKSKGTRYNFPSSIFYYQDAEGFMNFHAIRFLEGLRSIEYSRKAKEVKLTSNHWKLRI